MILTSVRVCRLALIVGCVWMAVLVSSSRAVFTTFPDGGDATPASIQDTIDSFRTAIGGINNANNAGPIVGGRREINWDGGTATTATPVATPMPTFQNRGVTLTTPGTRFLQSPVGVTEITSINPNYSTTFAPFSVQRIFTPEGSNITDVFISIPGTSGATPATVSGFGIVFSDVDLANTTKMEFFGLDGALLGTPFFAPIDTVTDAGFSFIGALGNAGERIARVRITTGTVALGPNDQNGNPVDVVVMDDFIFPEPKAVPEPAGALLVIFCLAGGAMWRARRRS